MNKMRVLTPFWDTRRWGRYKRQFEELASQVELHIIYTTGPDPPESDIIQFHSTGAHGRSSYRRLFIEATLAHQVKPDLIYSLSALSLQASALNMSLREKVPYLIRVRGDGRRERHPRYRWLNRARHNIVDRQTMAQASRLIPISQRLKDRMEAWGLDKQTLITEPVPNGIDLDLFPQRRPSSEFKVGYAGWLTAHKNSLWLLKLMRQLPQVPFKICGWINPDMEKNPLYDIPDNCEMLGEIPFSEMGQFYENISLLVNPSKTEGFPKTLLEAYAVGRPILINQNAISSDIPIIGQGLPLELQTWVSSILYFKGLQDTGGLDSLGDLARQTATRYSWDRFRDEMISHFMEVLE